MGKGKKRRISTRIARGIWAAVFLTTLILEVMALTELTKMQEKVQESCENSVKEIVDNAFDKRIGKIKEQMEEQRNLLARQCSDLMGGYAKELHICAGVISDIYENPQAFGTRSIQRVSEDIRGKLCMYYRIGNGRAYEDCREFIEKIGCSGTMFEKVCENSNIGSIYYYDEAENIFFSCDENAGAILDGLAEGQDLLYLNEYEPWKQDWYTNSARDVKDSIKISKAYKDKTTGRPVVTCTEPVYKGEEFRGVVAIDIYVDTLAGELAGTDSIIYDGRLVIADREGNVILSPNLEAGEREFQVIDIRTAEKEGLTAVAEKIIADETGFFDEEGAEEWIVYMPIESIDATETMKTIDMGWKAALIFSTEAIEEEKAVSGTIAAETNKEIENDVNGTVRKMRRFFLGGVIVAMAAGVLLGKLLAVRITKPVEALIKDVSVISEGNLDYRVTMDTRDELAELGNAFNKMTISLKEHMQNLKTVTADRERIATELDVAAHIQQGLLPAPVWDRPEEDSFELSAYMKPAKEVGGDFYDYFMTDENHVWVVMADVSGKGIPAALFMMLGKTLIKNLAAAYSTPAEILKEVNRQLNEHNEEQMFITCFLGVMDLGTGEFSFANAGHNFPYCCTDGKNFEKLETVPDIPLAVLDGADYQNHSAALGPGNLLFLYTDGVTEAMDEAGALYGDQRLCSVLDCLYAGGIGGQQFLQGVREDMKSFVGNAVQADDITMMIFANRTPKGEGQAPMDEQASADERLLKDKGLPGDGQPGNSVKRIRVKADLRELSRVLDFVEDSLLQEHLDKSFVTTMKFITDELFANIAKYAYKEGEGSAELAVSVSDGREVRLTFTDSGTAYDPLKQPAPDVSLPAEERTEGGLGVYLVKSMADGMEYEYREGKNVLTVWKKCGLS